ncbi:TPA: hypothetical protein DEW47_01985 [Patescibacteria group bacterium]|nr:MAG: hypothetical protein UT71_C0002G0051 [Parcubacteria group bacterium GW2011_GWF2_40_10]KKR47828.1 MAG: hypothetical protein UT83_C0003G0041 [Parcubacteria group bacterium GW2011_GWA2_40_143]KKR60259.1 MAG: hypothetical protein UT97_C0003G0041 [Parcubacteria group bacterium GW2011_GWC2_40_31]KKR77453.1 MAG: hypothetical protein UU20_C0007G0023 [Parcubacteria group bacterium GW2011_GWE2_40_8]KKR80896.1 MAG: hypothetical protein UU28_C0031G0008 [Parcubacteria group bacterium GW2011_GWD2_40_
MFSIKLKQKNNTKAKRGFTLLIAVLATSIILSISLGIFDIITKEMKLASLGRESQIAFYAADAGVECAFYWEINNPDGAESAFKKTTDGQGQAITCGIWDNKPWSTPVGKSDKSTFYLPLGDTSCAEVTVDKLTTNKTTITSRGYNMSFDGTKCGTDSARRVERAIKLTLTVN